MEDIHFLGKTTIIKILEDVLKSGDITGHEPLSEIVGRIEKCIESTTPADVAPIHHAKWEYHESRGHFAEGYYICPICGGRRNSESVYCQDCGTKMDE